MENKENREAIGGIVGAMSSASLVYGIILIIISMLILINTKEVYLIVTTLMGVYLLVRGVIDFLAVFSSQTPKRGLLLITSAVDVFAGIFVLAVPIFAASFMAFLIVYIIGISFVLNGIVNFNSAKVMATINIIIGILMFFFTKAFAISFAWLVAIVFLIAGTYIIAFGAKARNVARTLEN